MPHQTRAHTPVELIITSDGSPTMRHNLLGELYHSDRGAVGEANHVYIQAGFMKFISDNYPLGVARDEPINILEFGFGSGLNALLTACIAQQMRISVNYHTIELYPLILSDLDDFVIPQLLHPNQTSILQFLHCCAWNTDQEMAPHLSLLDAPKSPTESFNFVLHKHDVNFLQFDFGHYLSRFDVIYYDAFSPDSQPDLWTTDHFRNVASVMRPGCILTTYTSKGTVKQSLRNSGLQVERLKGAMGKRHMLRSVKTEGWEEDMVDSQI